LFPVLISFFVKGRRKMRRDRKEKTEGRKYKGKN
jgi:hypothetical protein